MPVTENDVRRPSSALNSVTNSRKEKKKQAKEERDRLKQVEKKRRRLEKALATAAAIRIELEKKKQRRKEEEQRLDEEGAALAEAVALQVLVDEDSDLIDTISMFVENESMRETEERGDISAEKESNDTAVKTGSPVDDEASDLSRSMAYIYPPVADRQMDTGITCDWEVSLHRSFVNAGNVGNNTLGKYVDLQGEQSDWKVFSSTEDKVKASNARAEAAEVAAGMAAAQAVAALRIAEEARAEAEAAKKAAEAAMNQVVDKKDLSERKLELAHQEEFQPRSIQIEMDELKARLEETERQLKEKTRQVVHLEHNLETMTQYLFEWKEKLPFQDVSLEREGETSERDSSTFTESSCGTVNQEA